MKIHPRLAGAIFITIYCIIGAIVSYILKKNVFESKIVIGIGFVGIFIINRLFVNKYYDEIVEEKRREEEIFNTKNNDKE